jgi:mono/diheme cytochrome c family protein
MRTVALLGCLLAFGCDDDTTGQDSGMPDLSVPTDLSMGDLAETGDLAVAPTAARGEYLVKFLLVCGDCHTTPDNQGAPSTNPADFLAGGRDFPVGSLHVFAKNLTPDPTTGLGNWTLDQIKDAIHTGVDDQGMPLFPIMPYYMFHNLTDSDTTSIALYLKSIPAQNHAVPESTATVPMAAPPIDDTKVPHTTLAAGDANFASAERGRYLVENSCIECHTRHLPPGAASVIDYTKVFGGGEEFMLGPITTISANITPDATGLASWTPMEIVDTLKTDKVMGTGPSCARRCPAARAGWAASPTAISPTSPTTCTRCRRSPTGCSAATTAACPSAFPTAADQNQSGDIWSIGLDVAKHGEAVVDADAPDFRRKSRQRGIHRRLEHRNRSEARPREINAATSTGPRQPTATCSPMRP